MHRDFKPDNVGVVRDLPEVELVLLDFGHAAKASESIDHMKGTVRYLAPEVLALKKGLSNEPYDHAIDVWGLGIMMMELNMQRHVQNETMALHWAKELQQRPWDPETTEVERLLPRLLCVDPTKRITMQQIVDTLRQQTGGTGKRRAKASDGRAVGPKKLFSREIVLEMPPSVDAEA